VGGGGLGGVDGVGGKGGSSDGGGRLGGLALTYSTRSLKTEGGGNDGAFASCSDRDTVATVQSVPLKKMQVDVFTAKPQ